MCSVDLKYILYDQTSCMKHGVYLHHYYTKLKKKNQPQYHINMEGNKTLLWLDFIPCIYNSYHTSLCFDIKLLASYLYKTFFD